MGTTPVSFRARLRLAARRLAPRRLARDESGATAVEFGLLMLPFLLLFFGLIELGLIFFAGVTLENAVIDSSRTIRTGQLQLASGDAATFKTSVCKHMNWLQGPCASAVRIDVRTVSTFASASSLTTPTTTCWDPGGPASLVVVRAYYAWPVITPLLQDALSAVNGKRTLTAATAFVNEPYTTTTASSVTCPS